MKNYTKQWKFISDRTRPPLTDEEVTYWSAALEKLLKVGVELEYNLPENNGNCRRDNYYCECVASFKPENPIPSTTMCYEQCARWDNGNCEIAKEFGCKGMFCAHFQKPCSTCSKFNRGCDTCANLYNPSKDPEKVRDNLVQLLKPTRFVGKVGDHGVYQVVKDGSLAGNGGVEVVTTGRRPEYHSMYKMVKNIISKSREKGAYVDQRCSIHVHILASYLTPGFNRGDFGKEYVTKELTELERPVPQIIAANFHQLMRRYQTSLIWMSSTLDDKRALTRWEKFRKSILRYSAAVKSLPKLAEEVMAIGHKPKYSLVNYEQMRFDENGDCTRLHYEIRHMDGNLSPSAITAQVLLVYALMLKAVRISKYGLLKSGDRDYMRLQSEIMDNLCNGDGNWGSSRLSDTSNIDPYIPALVDQSKQLVRFTRSVLRSQGNAAEVLESLAEKPVSIRRAEGKSWDEIEQELSSLGKSGAGKDKGFYSYIQSILDTASVAECESGSEWMDIVAQQLAVRDKKTEDKDEFLLRRNWVENFITTSLINNTVFWSDDLGGYSRS